MGKESRLLNKHLKTWKGTAWSPGRGTRRAGTGSGRGGKGLAGREPPARANGCGGRPCLPASLGYRMEIPGLPGEGAGAARSERLIHPRAAAGPGASPARRMPRAPLALLLLLTLLLAAPPPHGGSDSPKGKQKALRQREVLDVVRDAGPGTGSGAGGGGGRGMEEPRSPFVFGKM